MNIYHMWFNLKEAYQGPQRDIEFSKAVDAYLGALRDQGLIAGYRLTRRKFGFGPPSLGEFHCEVYCESLDQLDKAFGVVARRSGDIERLHHPVYSAVTDFQSALYRDFPADERA
jgi:hypothetical protein